MVKGKDTPSDFAVPEDAVMIKRAGPWEFHFSKADYSLFVVTTDYPRDLLSFLRMTCLNSSGLLKSISRIWNRTSQENCKNI